MALLTGKIQQSGHNDISIYEACDAKLQVETGVQNKRTSFIVIIKPVFGITIK
jgi:hypothetical protein